MKILQINSVYGVGSTGRIATDIHSTLVEENHRSWIAYGRGENQRKSHLIKIGREKEVYKHVIKTRVFDKHGFGSKKATEVFIKDVEKLDPDLIHLHNIHGYYLNIEVLFEYIKRTEKPVIWTLHDCWPFTGHCAYFDYVGCEKWKTQCYSCPEKNAYPSSKLMDKSTENFFDKKQIFTGVKNLTIVTPSLWLAGLVKESFLTEYPINIINNGIDTNLFKPSENNFRLKYKIDNKFIILGVASTWDRRKGLKYFFELSTKLKKDEIIVLIGLSEKQLKSLPENIIGFSRTNNIEELVDIYSAANVFINPTLEDNFPTTNIEALACGTPVITFETGGSIEIISKNTGIVVEKGKIDPLIAAIEQVKYNADEYKSEYCIERARLLYKKEDKYREYLSLYEEKII